MTTSQRFFRKTPEYLPANRWVSVSAYAGQLISDRSLETGASSLQFSSLQEGTYATASMGNEKATMQNLNDRLASYLEKVKSLEQENSRLEIQIREALESRGPEARDYSRYDGTLSQLRKEILDAILGKGNLMIQLDNAAVAVDDFKSKYEHELQMWQNVEADSNRLRKILDDTNLDRMQMESEFESLNEQLISLKKNHEQELAEIHAQISLAGVQVDVDSPKGEDLSRIMEEMREKYEKMALKNQKELKDWHDTKISAVTVEVTESTAALKETQLQERERRRTLQTLEIEIQSQTGLKVSLERSLEEINLRYSRQMEQYNAVLLQREDEMTQLRRKIMLQKQDYATLLNIKAQLEGEIQTYRRLLDGGELESQYTLKEEPMILNGAPKEWFGEVSLRTAEEELTAEPTVQTTEDEMVVSDNTETTESNN